MEFQLEIAGVQINMLHPEYLMEIFRLESKSLSVVYTTYNDHFIFKCDFTNLIMSDLTRYPYTIDPRQFLTNRANLK